jgi:hypothetical protein
MISEKVAANQIKPMQRRKSSIREVQEVILVNKNITGSSSTLQMFPQHHKFQYTADVPTTP